MPLVDLQNVNLTDFKLGKSGRAVKLYYNKEPVQICTSTMYLPFGVKSVNKEWSTFSEFAIDCSLNQSASEVSTAFRRSVEAIDKTIQQLVRENVSLFDNKNETAHPDFTYSPMLRENGTYPKLMKLQLPRDKNGNFESFIFDANKQKISIDEECITDVLCRGKTFKAIIECVKVWYYNGKVGSIWKVVQLKFAESSRTKANDDLNPNVVSANMYNNLMIED